MKLTLDALLVLDAIDRKGSFAAAAEEMNRVPSAVTYVVRKLEEDLDVLLFDRSGHRAKLTVAGRELLEQGRQLLTAAGDLECRVKRVATGWETELRIAYDTVVPIEALYPLVARFYAEGHATRIRLRADVPVGAYLSGGLDSSLISALAARTVTHGLRTFSLAFHSEEHDESRWQRQMAETLDVSADSMECTTAAIAAGMPAVMPHIECPILRTAPIPLHLLAGRVHERGMKVVLTGEGADEIFAGYDLFREARVRRFCGRQPTSARRPRLFQRLYPYLPGLHQQTPEYLARFFAFGAEALDDPLYSHRPRFRSTAAAKLFFSADLKATLGDYDAAEDLVARLPADFGRWHQLHQAQYLETAFLLPGYILSSQGDRVMMANAVEGRFPFLDPRVVAFAANLPPEAKLRGLREKHILKEAARGLVPDTIVDRPKQPYRAPDSESFAAPGTPAYLNEVLSPARIAESGLFNGPAVGKLKDAIR